MSAIVALPLLALGCETTGADPTGAVHGGDAATADAGDAAAPDVACPGGSWARPDGTCADAWPCPDGWIRLEGKPACGPPPLSDDCGTGSVALADGTCAPAWDCPDGWSRQPSSLGCGPPEPRSDCPEGSLALADGTCAPPWECPAGWERIEGGCAPLGRDPDCPAGHLPQLDGSCTDLGLDRCGDDPWGPRPWPDGTIYVSPEAEAEGADGSRDRPLPDLASALAAAGPDGTVALAAGEYRGDVALAASVTLGGRCARDTWIVGTVRKEDGGGARLLDLSLDAGRATHALTVRAGGVAAERVRLTGATLVATWAEAARLDVTDGLIESAAAFYALNGTDGADVSCTRCLLRPGANDGAIAYGGATLRLSQVSVVTAERPTQGASAVQLRSEARGVLEDLLVAGGYDTPLTVDVSGAAEVVRFAAVPRGRNRPARGCYIGEHSTLNVTDAFVLDATQDSLMVHGAGAVARVERLLVLGLPGEESGGAIPVLDGGSLDLTDARIFGYSSGGLYASTGGATAHARRLHISGTVPWAGSPGWAFGVAAQDGGTIVLEDSVLQDNAVVGVAVSDPGSEVRLVRVTVAGTTGTGGELGRGVQATDGGSLAIEEGRIEGSAGLGLLAAGAGTVVHAERLAVLATAPPDGLEGNGVQVSDGARLELDGAFVADGLGTGLALADAGSVAALARTAVVGTLPVGTGEAGAGVGVQRGGLLALEDVELAGNHRYGLTATGEGSRVEALRLRVQGTEAAEAGGAGIGLGVTDGATLTLADSLLEGNVGVGLALRGEGTVVAVARTRVRSTLGPEGADGEGRGVDVHLGARLTVDGLSLEGNEGMGLTAIGHGSRVEGRRLAALDTLATRSGRAGYGLAASDAARLELTDVLVSGNREIGLLVVNAASAGLERLAVVGTLAGGAGFGDGVFVDDDGRIDAAGLYAGGCERTGVVVSQSSVRLSRGLITGNGTGLVRQLETSVETEDVVVRGNGRDDALCEQACMERPPAPAAAGR